MPNPFGSNIPTPEPKPTNYSAGVSVWDSLWNGAQGIFESFVQYDTNRRWLELNGDQIQRQIDFENDLKTAGSGGTSVSTNTVLMVAAAAGVLLLVKGLK